MSFIHIGSETRIFRVSNGKVDCRQHYNFSIKNIVTSFNTNDAENVLRIIGTYIYHGFPKLKSTFWLWSSRRMGYLSGVTIDDVIYVMRCAFWYHLYNLKNVKNTHGRVLLLVKFLAAPLLKVTLFNGRSLRSLNCTNDTKSHKTSQ